MKQKLTTLLLAIVILYALPGCTTYYFTTSSLVSQLPKVDSSVPTDKRFNNGIAMAKVTDKNGKEYIAYVNLHTAVRITSKTGCSHTATLHQSQ